MTLPDTEPEEWLVQKLEGLAWPFEITKEALRSWINLPPNYQRMVVSRLLEIGQGSWATSTGCRRITSKDKCAVLCEPWFACARHGYRMILFIWTASFVSRLSIGITQHTALINHNNVGGASQRSSAPAFNGRPDDFML